MTTTGLNIERFVKRPVEITAVEFTGTLENHRGMDVFIGDTEHEHFDDGGFGFDPEAALASDGETPDLDGHQSQIQINTLEGPITASVGDWIIRGVKGEFYPCKPDVFEQSYEYVGPFEDPEQPALFDCD